MKKIKKRIPLQNKFHVKKGDEVLVVAGNHKGSSGKVLEVQRKTNRVIIEGVHLIKKAIRKSQDNPGGGIQEREGTIHLSNVKKVEAEKKAPAAKKTAAKKTTATKTAAKKTTAKAETK